MNHKITRVEGDAVYFVCSGAPRLEMKTYGAPLKCAVCSCANPAPLLESSMQVADGYTEQEQKGYEGTSLLDELLPIGQWTDALAKA
jgi:hypothetical protein